MQLPKRSGILGINISRVDRRQACDVVTKAAIDRIPLGISALATHGVMTGVQDRLHGERLNSLDVLTPDGQPIRWALNVLYGAQIAERAYGPNLMRDVCKELSSVGGRVFLFGSTRDTLQKLASNLRQEYPGLQIAGCLPSQFRKGTREEFLEVLEKIKDGRPNVCFVGLGCPRQEIFVYEALPFIECPFVAVGAAFDFLAGNDSEPHELLQRFGFQWAHRLFRSPRRLAYRYLVLGPIFLALTIQQALQRSRRALRPIVTPPPASEYYI